VDLVRDPAWQFVGAIVAVIAIAATFAVYLLQRERKEFSFGVFYQTPLLTVAEELAARVRVTFDGNAIRNLRLVVLGFKNSGNRPIVTSDFEREVRITMSSGSTILSCDISKQSPANLDVQAAIHGHELRLSPVLLNPHDYVLLKLLVGCDSPIVPLVDARIVGVRNLTPLMRSDEIAGWRKVRQNVVLLPVFSLLAIGVSYWANEPSLFHGSILFACATVPFVLVQWILEHATNRANRYVDGA